MSFIFNLPFFFLTRFFSYKNKNQKIQEILFRKVVFLIKFNHVWLFKVFLKLYKNIDFLNYCVYKKEDIIASIVNGEAINPKRGLLHVAVDSDNVLFVKLLLSFGCNVNSLDSCGNIPAVVALKNKNLSMLLYLFTNGSDIDENVGEVFWEDHLTEILENSELLNFFLCNTNFLNERSKYYLTFLSLRSRRFDLAEKFASLIFNPNLFFDNRFRPDLHFGAMPIVSPANNVLLSNSNGLLHVSVISGSFATVKVLLELGFDPYLLDMSGDSVFEYSLTNAGIFDLLVSYGADVNYWLDEETVLMKIIRKKDLFGVKFLIDKKVDINLYKDGGCTPLQLSLLERNFEIASCLIDGGAELLFLGWYEYIKSIELSFSLAINNDKACGEKIKILYSHYILSVNVAKVSKINLINKI